MTNLLLLIIPIVLYSLSGIVDAAMDTLSHHFNTSIFSRLDPYFWNPTVSWKNKYVDRDPTKDYIKWTIIGFKVTKPVQITDAWHFFKFIREVFIALAICAAGIIGFMHGFWWSLSYLVLLGIVRNSAFSLFYNKILIK